jgi:centromere-localized protein 2
MAPTEEAILSNFLLPPSPLPSIITLKAFTELFPRAQQSSPHVRALYRDLQQQRARVVDVVARNVAAEAKRGNAQRRAVVRERRHAEREDQDDEIGIENAVSFDKAIVLFGWLTTLSVIWTFVKFRLH